MSITKMKQNIDVTADIPSGIDLTEWMNILKNAIESAAGCIDLKERDDRVIPSSSIIVTFGEVTIYKTIKD